MRIQARDLKPGVMLDLSNCEHLCKEDIDIAGNVRPIVTEVWKEGKNRKEPSRVVVMAGGFMPFEVPPDYEFETPFG